MTKRLQMNQETPKSGEKSPKTKKTSAVRDSKNFTFVIYDFVTCFINNI